MKKTAPEIKTLEINYKDRTFNIEYFQRKGKKETILFVHGLGGSKENFFEACKSDSVAEHTLFCFDNPGTGNSTYYDEAPLCLDDLASITSIFVEKVGIDNFVLCGASMGGLITLLYLERGGLEKVKGYINIEGNLMPEDCMFSSKVVSYDLLTFASEMFPKTIQEMIEKRNTGYHIIANNLQLNTNVTAYYHYSFQTVEYSATGHLLEQFVSLPIPCLFIYGDANRTLSYLSTLRQQNMNVKEISGSDHFVFYDNPKELYGTIGQFIDQSRF